MLSVLFGLLSALALLIVKMQAVLSYSPDISGSEMSGISAIQLLLDGEDIYTDPEKAPFRLTQYTPLYFTIVTFLVKIVGLTGVDVHKIYLASRLVSNFFTLSAVSIAGYFIYRVTKQKIAAFLTGLALFHVLSFWFLTTSRPDSLLVLLTTLFIVSVYYGLENKDQKLWFLAIFIGVSAFFVKQSGAILPISAGVFWLAQRDFKMLLKLTAFGILTFGIYLAILPINTIQLFFLNIVGGVANSASWGWFYDWTLEHWLLQFAPLMVLNALVSSYTIYYRPHGFHLFLVIASVLFFLFATSTAFKIGAGVGYYQDYLIVAMIQLVLAFTQTNDFTNLKTGFVKSGVALFMMMAFLHCSLYMYMKYKSGISRNFEALYTEERKVAAYLREQKNLKPTEYIYVCNSENFQGSYLSFFLFKNNLIPFPDLVYLADQNGTFNYDEFRRMVDEKEIRFVISPKGKAPANILSYNFGNTLKYSSTMGSYDIYEADKR
ncbi:ArnT family glycosyltransferase [Dyadobacter soli]|uniref:ArnT family glycosyltransferase n=1 Tax=Dyadobacter soli TaxID=659014 RepID=UPI000B7DA5F3|nr:hypothetical protein [Dyadobacter soli]